MSLKRRHFLWAGLLGGGIFLNRAQAYTLTAAAKDTPWLTAGGVVLVPDWWLSQVLGLELLPSQALDRQPLRWFGEEFSLPILYGPPDWPGRYVRLTELATALKAKATPKGLGLEFPPVKVTAIRTSAERFVLEFSRPTPWQFQQQRNLAVLTLYTDLAVALPTTVEPIQKLTLLPNTTPPQLQLNLSREPLTKTYDAPYRLVLDFKNQSNPRTYEQRWRPGLTYQQWEFSNPNPQRVHVLVMDKSYSWQLVHSPTKQSLRTFAQGAKALAAINGGFFNLNNGFPLGALRQTGQWRSGPILNRGAVGWKDEELAFDRLDWQGVVELDQGRFALVGWNTAYVKAGISVYTPEWGERYESLQEQETIVTVQAGVSSLPIRLAQRGTPVLIPAEGYLLVGRGYGAVLLEQQLAEPRPATSSITLIPPTWQQYPNILGAGPLLLKDNTRVLDAELEKFQPDVKNTSAPRTAIGQRADGSRLWVVAEGRQTRAKGLTLEELTTFLEKLGCSNALNLDGGTSSGLYLGGTLRTIPNSRNSDGERLLSNALILGEPTGKP